jgi:hypothetical protein
MIPMEWLGWDWFIIIGLIAILNSYDVFGAVRTAALETKGPPIDRWLWIGFLGSEP